MHVILSLERRPEMAAGEAEAVRRVVVRAGQVVRVGSTEWADLCVAGDSQMSDEHFQVECTADACLVTPLGEATITVNGQETPSVYEAAHQDRIAAGQCEFSLAFPHAAANDEQPDLDEEESPAPPADVVWPNLRHQELSPVLDAISLSDDAMVQANSHPQPDRLFSVLLESGLPVDAIQLMAHLLPKRSAVWWALKCVETMDDAETEPLATVQQWCEDPSEEHRRACGVCAETGAPDRPEASLAWAAFYSGGSMVMDEAIEAPPDDTLTGHMVTAALGAAACANDDPAALMHRFLESAPAIAEGNVPWDSGDAEAQA